jgi:DNA-binding GntR family transcriptional regulator
MEAAAAQGDRDALIAADEAFHRTLIRLSDHDLLAHLWAGLYPRIHQIMSLRDDQDVDLTDIAATHPPIVRALEARDVACAVRLVSEHFHALADFDPASIAAEPE